MPYTGLEPARRPLSSDDITDGIISTADLADSAVTIAKIDDATLTALSSVMSSTATTAAQRAALGLDTGDSPDFTGITFGGGAEALAAYDEGFSTSAFTPSWTFGAAAVGQAYSVQHGYYIKIGKICFFRARTTFTAKGSSAGQARLIGLPFTAANISGNTAGICHIANAENLNVDATPFGAIAGEIGGATSSVTVWWENNDNAAADALDEACFNNNTSLSMWGWYLTA